MTECEKIIKKGIVGIEFLQPEVICDFYVDENRKKTWAVLLDLYVEFSRVCDKFGLSYFTDGGTTLGAVRHGGFIPWDDDLDVCLPRKDYEILKTLKNEFSEPYFLQSAYTDAEYGRSFLRLTNSNTSVVVEPFNYLDCNHGIYIDIFPLDKVTSDDYLERRNSIHDLIMINSAYMRRNFEPKSVGDLEKVNKYKRLFEAPYRIFDKIENIAMEDEGKDTEYLSLLVSTLYSPEKKIWPKSIFDSYVLKGFCGIKVRVPSGFDEQLRIYFGDYWEYPPVSERGKWHDMQFYPDVPFAENDKLYKKNKRMAIVLAAGMGSRLTPLTNFVPKCMVEVKGTPIIDNLLEKINSTGEFDKVLIVDGYLGDVLKKHLGNAYGDLEIEYIDNPIYKTTNNVYSLYLALRNVQQDCALFESDIYVDQSIVDIVATAKSDCDIVSSKYDERIMNGTVVFTESTTNRVRMLCTKSQQTNEMNMSVAQKTVNIYHFSKKFLKTKLAPALETYVKAGNLNSYYELVIGSLIYLGNDNINICEVPADSWCEIDDMDDLDIANRCSF